MAGAADSSAVTIAAIQALLAITCGLGVGFSLGVIGGGGSILAVPLMVYVVGVANPHVAIGTSALAVATNAACNLFPHARARSVKWRCAALYAVTGVVGALAGAQVGMRVDGHRLLALFALVMVAVGILMLRGRAAGGDPAAECNRGNAPTVLGYGFVTGIVSGFFGIGGGFLIVPGLIAATGMPMLNAIASSLVAVSAFGFTTALSYAVAGEIDWLLAATFIVGGIAGGLMGAAPATRLSHTRGALRTGFAILVFAVAAYILWRSLRGG